jgi:hypothetical protein
VNFPLSRYPYRPFSVLPYPCLSNATNCSRLHNNVEQTDAPSLTCDDLYVWRQLTSMNRQYGVPVLMQGSTEDTNSGREIGGMRLGG